MKCLVTYLSLLLTSAAFLGCGDSDSASKSETTAELCKDNVDNDDNGAKDCDEAGCQGFDFCAPTWTTTWVSAQQKTELQNLPPEPGLANNTLRQVIQLTLGGEAVRFSFSNVFGNAPLTITAAAAAPSLGEGKIDTEAQIPLTFSGAESVTIEAGEQATSDEIDWALAPLADIAVTIRLDDAPPSDVTGHPGSRTTSYLATGDAVSEEAISEATCEHWYFLSSVDVLAHPNSRAIVVLGDSISDGSGSTTDGNDRWPNILSRRLLDNPGTEHIAVLNQGIGGNCVARVCLGPPALDRFDRDVLEPFGVKWLIILEGINDLNSKITAERLIDAYTSFAKKAHAEDIRVIGGTIMPCGGHSYYNEDLEASRQEINDWIRTTDKLDGFIDFDKITRDASTPTRLSSDVSSSDSLHPSADGYKIMGDAIDLTLFETP